MEREWMIYEMRGMINHINTFIYNVEIQLNVYTMHSPTEFGVIVMCSNIESISFYL